MKEDLTTEQLSDTFSEIFKQSDRASAIVAGGVLEEILQRMIASFFLPHASVIKNMFGGVAPISTFGAKIDLAYLLGLINEIEFADLKLIKNIRNDFAHSIKEITFDTDNIKDRCLQLQSLNKTNPPKEVINNIKNIKLFFQINTTLLATILFDKTKDIKHIGVYDYGTSKS